MPNGNGGRLFAVRLGLAQSASLIAVFFGVLYLAQQHIQPAKRSSADIQTSATNSGQHAQDQNNPASDTGQDSKSSIGTPVRPPTANKESDQHYPNPQEEANYIARLDLSAQQWMNYAAWVMAILTAVGIFLIWRTLIHTRDAARSAQGMLKEAQKTTLAAEKTIEIERDIGQAQTRAYIHINNAIVKWKEHTGSGYGTSPEFTISVTNTGNSPARAFRWAVQTVFVYPNAKSDLRGSKDVAPGNWGKDIAARETETLTLFCLPSFLEPPDVTAFNAGELHMFATIYTAFTDVFEKDIRDEYSFAVHFPQPALGAAFNMHPHPLSAENFVAMQKPPQERENK